MTHFRCILSSVLSAVAKMCFVLAIVRLCSTALNFEFGVSRHYLRVLEWIFELGSSKIKKVESKQRLLQRRPAATDNVQTSITATSGAEAPMHADCSRPDEEKEKEKEEGKESKLGKRAYSSENLAGRPAAQISQSHRLKRVSKVDAAPVFLMDDFLEEENSSSSDDAETSTVDQPQRRPSPAQRVHEFELKDAMKLVICGVAAIIDDQVTKRFTREELKTWNLLTRTDARNYHFMSRSLGLCWLFGFIVRYTILMPLRILFAAIGFVWLLSTMTLIGCLPDSLRSKPFKLVSLMSFRMFACALTSKLKFHNRQFKAKRGEICVANHTSPIDVVVMACDNCYALVGQRHGGLLGILEHVLSRAMNHIWFDRGEMRDRQLVSERLRQHVTCKHNLPVLIFPEGTCINNSAVMMFRKGSFELTDRVCPVAIKYDARFGDPFWNSSKQSYVQYILMMMSSWAIKCDVWYLPPMTRLHEESSAEFANRVKAEIAKQAGLQDLAWDGQLKRSAIKPSWLYQQQQNYANRLKID